MEKDTTMKTGDLQMTDMRLSREMYIINAVEIDPKNGTIVINTAYGPYKDYDEAVVNMKKRYHEALEVRELEDNDACDTDTCEAIPGGYSTNEEAGIYVYADFAFGQLLEIVSYTIKRIEIPV